MVKKVQEISSVTVQKIIRNPNQVTLDEIYVQVKNHDLKKCEESAKRFLKEMSK